MAKKTVRRKSKPLRAPADVMKEMNERVDREVERFARKVLIVDGGRVRKLTEQEVQIAVQAGRPGAKGRPANKGAAARSRR